MIRNFFLLSWLNYEYLSKMIPLYYVLSNCIKINSKNDLINNYYSILILNNF